MGCVVVKGVECGCCGGHVCSFLLMSTRGRREGGCGRGVDS